MGFWIFMFGVNLLLPVMMVGFGRLFCKHPPKNINGIYGYRTRRAMASQEAWDFSQRYFGKCWFYSGFVVLFLVVIGMLLLFGKSEDMVEIYGGILSMVGCVFMILPIIPTEHELKKRFGT